MITSPPIGADKISNFRPNLNGDYNDNRLGGVLKAIYPDVDAAILVDCSLGTPVLVHEAHPVRAG